MRWVSLDVAVARSGVARWEGASLGPTSVVRPRGKAGKYAVVTGGEMTVYASRWEAWRSVLEGLELIVVEAGYVRFPKAALALGEARGVVKGFAEVLGVQQVLDVATSEWRRVASEGLGGSWPSSTELKKLRAQVLVREHFGRDVSGDEADAVLAGYWRVRTIGATT